MESACACMRVCAREAFTRVFFFVFFLAIRDANVVGNDKCTDGGCLFSHAAVLVSSHVSATWQQQR